MKYILCWFWPISINGVNNSVVLSTMHYSSFYIANVKISASLDSKWSPGPGLLYIMFLRITPITQKPRHKKEQNAQSCQCWIIKYIYEITTILNSNACNKPIIFHKVFHNIFMWSLNPHTLYLISYCANEIQLQLLNNYFRHVSEILLNTSSNSLLRHMQIRFS